MMDVVSSVGAIVGLVFNFAKAIKCCHDIKGRYDEVDHTIASVKDELETLQGALKQLMALMMNDLDALSSQWDSEKYLPLIFTGAMKGFDRTILVLMEDLKGLHSKVRDGGNEMGKRKKAAFMWNESGLNGHCVQLRSQAAALQLLLGVLQTGSMSDFKKELKDLKGLIEKLAIMSPPSIPDEPPVYTPKQDPTFHLIDFRDDLMDIEKVYPAHMDNPPALHSAHGEILQQEMNPNSTGENSKSISQHTGTEGIREVNDLGTSQPVSSTLRSEYLPDKLCDIASLPKMPLRFRSKSTLTTREQLRSNNSASDSSDGLPIPPPKEDLDREDLNGIDLHREDLRSPMPPLKAKPQPQPTPKDLGIIHSSPSSSSKPRSRQKLTRLSSVKSNKPPEIQAISRRLSKLRLASSSRSPPSSLFLAVLTNDLETLSQLLKAGDDIESRHPTTNSTPLIVAASQGHFAMLELLLTNNANLQAIDSSCRTALHHAASSNSPECTELLLAYGADPNSEDHEKETPLHRAVRYLRSESVELLLEMTNDPLKLKTLRGQTALHLAARNRGLNIISKLCEGAKRIEHATTCPQDGEDCECSIVYVGTETEDVAGETALQFALRQRSMEAISLLLKYTAVGKNAPQRVKNWSSQSLEVEEVMAWERPLHYAMRGSSKTLAKRLLDAGADVEMLNSEGKTPSEVAAERDNWEGVWSLLRDGGTKVVSWVIEKLTNEEFEQLYGVAGEYEYNSLGKLLLDESIQKQQWGKLHFLLQNGSFTTSEKKAIAWTLNYETVLPQVIWQCEEGLRANLMRKMLELGADGEVQSHNAPEYDEESGEYCDEETWQCLLHAAAEKNDIQLAQVLVEFGALVTDRDSEGRNAFLVAVLKADFETTVYFHTLLTTHFATRPDFLAEITDEASLHAIKHDSLQTLKLLLPNTLLTTPRLALLTEAISLGREEIARYLLRRGCDPRGLDYGNLNFNDLNVFMYWGEKFPRALKGKEVASDLEGWMMCLWMIQCPVERRWEWDLDPETRAAIVGDTRHTGG